METECSVITIGYKSLENIKNRINECFDGVNPPSEFILIINYYSDISWDILDYAKNEKRITRFIFNSQNIGFAKAMNLGYKVSKSKNLLILNDDCSINQSTMKGLIDLLDNDKVGISSILTGSHKNDDRPMPQGFILGLKKEMIDKIGGYIYDEMASPLGCERELTYRAMYNGYEMRTNNKLYYRHIHDISSNPNTVINYLGELMSPMGENAFQYESIKKLDKLMDFYKKKLNG